MMKLIYATSNPAKVKHMNSMLEGLEIEIIGLCDMENVKLPEIDENGNNPLENAEIKAKSYHKVLNKPLFSADSGLYLSGILDNKQPGVHVRRVNGKELTDDEMIEYYAGIARESGGEIRARYRNGICLIIDENTIHKYDGEDIGSEEFIICDTPHKNRNKGFPIDSISKNTAGEYFMDINKRTKHDETGEREWAFRSFFRRVLFEEK